MLTEKDQKKNWTELSWWNITKRHRKKQIIFYLLTITSAVLASVIDQNAISDLTKVMRGEWKPEFKVFENIWIEQKKFERFGEEGGVFFYLLFAAALSIFYGAIVIAHVFYAYYFINKVNRSLRARLMAKLFRLKGSYDKKTVLNIFNNDIQRFTQNVIFVPNQLFYFFLSSVLGVWLIFKKQGGGNKSISYNILGVGLAYSLLIMAVIYLLDRLLYKVDLEFQKIFKEQTKKEDVIINNRDLIIKKDLVTDFQDEYKKTVNDTWNEADIKDLTYVVSWVIPSFCLVPYADFILLPLFRKMGENALLASKVFGKLFGGIKKMIERLRDYPYYFSAVKRLNDFLTQPERNDIQKNIFVAEPISNLRLVQVNFGYKKNKLVLNKLDLEFRRGEINYLRGANGFGKSTIINLIMGLYSPEDGEILVNDNQKLGDLNLVEWRKKIAYAEHQNLIENGLSTGQKQLIDIETTLNRHAQKEIFIFDEADNSLDENNKKVVRHQLEKVAKNKLVILISH